MAVPAPFQMIDLRLGDCIEVMKQLEAQSFSCCITDPPYNYDFIGKDWKVDEINRRVKRVKDSNTLVKNIPYGSGLSGGVRNERWYQRFRQHTYDYRQWCVDWSGELFRLLVPGAYVAAFSSARGAAHLQVALEEAGFYPRDMLVWRRNSGIPRGLNIERKLEKLGHPHPENWKGWHSCLRNEWEAICLVQKPLQKNYIETMMDWNVGLMKTCANGSGFQTNILEGFSYDEEDRQWSHCTVKPKALIRFLIQLLVPNGPQQRVIDPFCGTGTTCLMAQQLGVRSLGIDISKSYLETAAVRIGAFRKLHQAYLWTE